MSTNPPYRDLLESCRRRPPRVALVLGSGLGKLADHFASEIAVPFAAVPEMAAATVDGHKGQLHLATWAGQRVLVFLGRLHFYEGQPWRRIEQPVITAHELGAKILFMTNAAGGIRADLAAGSLMPIRAHLEWTRPFSRAFKAHFILAPSKQSQGENMPASSYSGRLLDILERAGAEEGQTAAAGVYAQVTGPCYETPAEIRALRSCGADVVGMSTCREVNRGHALGMECAALSCVTNRAAGLAGGPIHHAEVVAAGRAVTERLGRVVQAFLRTV